MLSTIIGATRYATVTAEEREFFNEHMESAAYQLERFGYDCRQESAEEAWESITQSRKTGENLDDVLGRILERKSEEARKEVELLKQGKL